MSSDPILLESLAAPKRNAIVGGPFGSNLVSKDYVDAGVPVIRGQNMGGKWVSGQFVYVSEEKARQLSANTARPGDLIFTQRGTLGQVSIVPEKPFDEYIVSQSQMKITPDLTKTDIDFLYYVFRSETQQSYIMNSSIQTGVPHTNLGILKRTPINLPPLTIQREVGAILSSFDNRIALLRETNATLEAIAQALFKSWFVDFDPVRAKAKGLEPKGGDADTAALFPEGFEEGDHGLVPRGWARVPFTNTIKVVGGGTPKTSVPEYWGGDIPWFSVVDAPASSDVFVLDTQKHVTGLGVEKSSTKVLPVGTTIISARGTVGRLALVGTEMAMNQSCYGLRGLAGDAYFTYFNTSRLIETLLQRTHGSVFDTITTETLAGVSVIYPPSKVILAFESLVDATMLRIKENIRHVRTLTSIRDALLPRLISGQLRLPEAKTLLKHAA